MSTPSPVDHDSPSLPSGRVTPGDRSTTIAEEVSTHIKPGGGDKVFPPYCNTWSQKFNDDTPFTGSPPIADGDYELVSRIRVKHNYCNIPNAKITAIKCNSELNDASHVSIGHKVTCDPSVGLICKNADQFIPILGTTEPCENYYIQLYCDCPKPTTQLPSTTTASPEPSTVTTTVRPSTVSVETVSTDGRSEREFHCTRGINRVEMSLRLLITIFSIPETGV